MISEKEVLDLVISYLNSFCLYLPQYVEQLFAIYKKSRILLQTNRLKQDNKNKKQSSRQNDDHHQYQQYQFQNRGSESDQELKRLLGEGIEDELRVRMAGLKDAEALVKSHDHEIAGEVFRLMDTSLVGCINRMDLIDTFDIAMSTALDTISLKCEISNRIVAEQSWVTTHRSPLTRPNSDPTTRSRSVSLLSLPSSPSSTSHTNDNLQTNALKTLSNSNSTTSNSISISQSKTTNSFFNLFNKPNANGGKTSTSAGESVNDRAYISGSMAAAAIIASAEEEEEPSGGDKTHGGTGQGMRDSRLVFFKRGSSMTPVTANMSSESRARETHIPIQHTTASLSLSRSLASPKQTSRAINNNHSIKNQDDTDLISFDHIDIPAPLCHVSDELEYSGWRELQGGHSLTDQFNPSALRSLTNSDPTARTQFTRGHQELHGFSSSDDDDDTHEVWENYFPLNNLNKNAKTDVSRLSHSVSNDRLASGIYIPDDLDIDHPNSGSGSLLGTRSVSMGTLDTCTAPNNPYKSEEGSYGHSINNNGAGSVGGRDTTDTTGDPSDEAQIQNLLSLLGHMGQA